MSALPNPIPPSPQAATSSSYIHFPDVIPCCGVGSCLSSIYPDWPDCFGCTFRTTCCCFRNELILMKPGRFDDTRLSIFHILCDIGPCQFLMKTQNQICCEDCRCSVPPDDRDVPCILTIFFITLYYRDGMTLHCFRRAKNME